MASTLFGPMMLFLLPLLLPGNPTTQPVPVKKMVAHVPAECQIVMTADVSTLLPHVFSTTNKLTSHPFVQNNMRLRQMVLRGVMMVKMQRASLQQRLGIDPIKAISYVTVGVHFKKRMRRPRAVVILGGSFSPAKVGPLMAAMMGNTSTPKTLKDGFTYIDGGRRNPTLGWYAKGPMFIGKRKHLLPFAKAGSLRGGNKMPADSTKAKLASNYLPRSLLSLGFAVPKSLQARLSRRGPATVRKLFSKMSYVQGALQYNGSSLLLEHPDAAIRAKYAGLFRGFGLLAMSGDYATRGLLQLASTLLDPTDTSLPRQLRALAKHKDTFLPLIMKKLGRNPVKFKIWTAEDQVNMQLLGNPGLGVMGLGAAVGFLTFGTMQRMAAPKAAAPARVYRAPTQTAVKSSSAKQGKNATKPAKTAPRKAAPAIKPSK